MNERLKLAGKPAISKLDDLPKDFKVKDAYLDEAEAILFDLAKLYPDIKVSQLPSNAIMLDLNSPIMNDKESK